MSRSRGVTRVVGLRAWRSAAAALALAAFLPLAPAHAAGESADPVFGVEAGAAVLAFLPVDPAERDEALVLTDSSALDAVACAKATTGCLRLRALLVEHFTGGKDGANASAFAIRGGSDASAGPVIPEFVLKGDETRLYVTVLPYERLLEAEVRSSDSSGGGGVAATGLETVANGHHDGRGADLSGTCNPMATGDNFTDPQELPGTDPAAMGDLWATATALTDDGSGIASSCVK